MGPNNMPVSCDSSTAILSSAIRDSLSTTSSSQQSSNLTNNLNLNQIKRLLLPNIEYVEAPSDFGNSVHEPLKAKYSVLNGAAAQHQPADKDSNQTNASVSAQSTTNINGHNSKQQQQQLQQQQQQNTVLQPKQILFSRENVQIGWKSSGRKWQVGAGMKNVGNTCYLNSTLQALFHVPAFANWLFSDVEHREKCEETCGSQGGCIICAMAKTLIQSQNNQQPLEPWLVYSKLRIVCKHLVPGHQEDAHEFLRYLMEAMEKAYLLRFKNSKEFDQMTKETTPINQILGGYLKSSVKCLACGYVSVTFQHFEDLLLDIRKANSIEEALVVHFARERLEDMGYKCESCKKKVSATKQFSLERAPISLCIQLKRFSMMGGKLNKHVTIRPKLDLSPYSSRKSSEPLNYRLVAMVTHLGASQHCGHYTAIGLTDAGGYYQFDDSCVRSVSMQNVVNTNAYIMFYELEDSSSVYNNQHPSTVTSASPKSNSTPTSTSVSSALLPYKSNAETKTKPESNGFIGPIMTNGMKLLNGNATATATNSNGMNGTTGSKLVNSNKLTNGYSSKLTLNGLATPSAAATSPTAKIADNKLSIRFKNVQKNNETETGTTTTTYGVHTNGHTEANGTKKSPPSTNHQTENKSETKNPTLQILPSMPKLDLSPATTSSASSSACSSASSSTTSSASSSPKIYNLNDDDDDDDYINETVAIETIQNTKFNSLPTKLTNGHKTLSSTVTSSHHQKQQRSLVPYAFNDDSDSNNFTDDESSKSPPIIIKTAAGICQVTSATQKNTFTNNNNSTGSPANGFSNVKNRFTGDYVVSSLKSNSHMGYGGASVKNWNGNISSMEREVKADKMDDRKRRNEENNSDSEMDRGRVKKVKSNNNTNGRDNPGYNSFQEQQNQLNNRNNRNNGNNNNNNNPNANRHFNSNNFGGGGYRNQNNNYNNHNINRNSNSNSNNNNSNFRGNRNHRGGGHHNPFSFNRRH